MGMPVRVTAAAVMCLGLAACGNTTEGTVAMTTEPVASPTSAAAPPNAMTMTCGEFTKLDQPVRLEVVRTILAEQAGVPGQPGPEIAEGMANAICEFLPDQTVRAVLTAAPPP
jgi:hypothetical protein